MPSRKHTPPPSPENPSNPGTPGWFYDEIMRHVEPALMSDRINESIKRGENETPEDFAKRLKHYENAKHVFAAVARDIGQIAERDGTLAHRAKKQTQREEEQKEDNGAVQHIELSLDEPTAP